MNTKPGESERALAAKQRVEAGLEALRVELAPYVTKHMRDRHGSHWRHYASRAPRDESSGELDVYALLKTSFDQWSDLFRHDAKLRRARSFISLALDARNSAAHFSGEMEAREALRYLGAMRELLAAVGATPQVAITGGLYEAERTVSGGQPAAALAALALEEPPLPDRLRPWREVCELRPDVLEARFSDAEFAANLALVDQGEGGEEYGDPATFFGITYATEGLRRVLTATIARVTGHGGEPVGGLQTNFGGGKTHTMLALHRLAGTAEAGYPPERLDGIGPIFETAGVETVGRETRAVFVGTRGIPAALGCAALLTASRTRAMFQRKRPHLHFRHSARTRRSATCGRKRTKTPWETTGHLSTRHSVTPAAQLEQTSALERGSPFDL